MNTFTHLVPLAAGSGWDHDGFWWLPLLLLWASVLGAAIWFVLRTRRAGKRSGIERAREILAERYAGGELSGEEYRERLEDLRRHP
jgi:putative membrane protein